MADLSAYLDFSLQFDYTTSTIKLTDTSTYPVGVASGITGIINSTQPDGITRMGAWATPDVIYSAGALTVGSIELRLTSANGPQQGNYTVTYTVSHPSYSPTTKTKTFNLAYTRPLSVITTSFDVFTPVLSLSDGTNYASSAFLAPTITKAWTVNVGTVGTRTATTDTIDLAITGLYYDATYTGTLVTNLTYQHSTYTYLTVKDRVIGNISANAAKPTPFTTLQTYLKTIKSRYDALTSSAKSQPAREDYEYAVGLFQNINNRMCANDLVGLNTQLQDFLNVYNGYVSTTVVNTNTAIPAYDFTACNCGVGGTSSQTILKLTPEQIIYTTVNDVYSIAANTLLESIVIIPNSNLTNFQIGTAAGLGDIYPATNLTMNVALPILLNNYAITPTTIYFTNMAGSTKIIFYKR